MAFSSRRALLACGRGLRRVLLAVPFLCYLIPYVRPIYDRIRELNEARGDIAYYYALWVTFVAALVGAAVVSAVLEGAAERAAPRRAKPRSGCDRGCRRRCRRCCSGCFGSNVLTALFAVAVVVSLVVWLGVGTLGRAASYDWGGKGYDPAQHHGRPYWLELLHRCALYAGVGSLVPMSMLGVPLSRSSALWRAAGLSFEEAVALHRALGHLMIGLLTFHAIGYMVAWLSESSEVLLDELTDWLRCEREHRCGHINNLAGLIAWLAGLLLWATSLRCFRRRRYDVFFIAHQLHFVFFGFGAIHWPACICFAAPAVVFYTADLAMRLHVRVRVVANARAHHDGASADACMATLLVPMPMPSPPARARTGASPLRPQTPKHNGHPPVEASPGARCPFADGDEKSTPDGVPRVVRGGGGAAAARAWEGGTVHLALQSPAASFLRRLEWHPFTIAGVVGADSPRPSMLVHVSRTKRWTARLIDHVATLPTAEAVRRSDQSLADRNWSADIADRTGLQLRVVGPLPPPPSLVALEDAAAAGTPLLLVGGGAGLTPLVALVRRLARRRELRPTSALVAHVRLVCIARETSKLEILDGAMLPRDSDDDTTGFAWLRTEIHVTSPSAFDFAEACGGRTAAVDAEVGEAAAGFAGPCRLAAIPGTMTLRATRAEYALPAAPPPLTAGAGGGGMGSLRVRESASVVGALVGFVGTAWPLLWGSAAAPLYRRNVSTSASGLGGLAATTAAAFAGAVALLSLVDGAARLLARFGRSPHAPIVRALRVTAPAPVEPSGTRGTELPDLEIAVTIANGEGEDRRAAPPCCDVPVASLGRPDLGAIVGRMLAAHPTTRVVGAGPETMVAVLDATVAKVGGGVPPAVVRLTHSM